MPTRTVSIFAICFCSLSCLPAVGATIYNNLTPNNLIAVASRTDANGFEIEAADDFILGDPTLITGASFTGLLSPGATSDISQIVLEIYRVFPLDSNTVRTPNVPSRVNSPSDVAFDSRDSLASDLSFAATVLDGSFTALNSIQPGGIHPSPTQTTGGDGTLTGQEVQFDVTLNNPFTLPAGHYFFIPQVTLSSGGQFYWLSASRPISGPGTTPFLPDLQAWTRDAALDPDWLRVGQDIVGGSPFPTFNTAFSLEGTALPEPSTTVILFGGLALLAIRRYCVR